MNFFENIYNQIFSKKGTPEYNGKKYLVQEMYFLTENEAEEFQSWIKEKEGQTIISTVMAGIKHKKAGLSELNQRFSIYESPQSNGFYVLSEDFLDKKQSQFLLEYIKNRVLELGYILNHSSKEIFEENNNVKTRLSYYLKPKLKNFKMPIDQKYGNIHIECLLINDKPDYVKLLANIYSDRNYKEAEDFEELLQNLSPA